MIDTLEDEVEARPLVSLLVAIGIGFLLGKLIHR
jgi:ElaB/YqjD/DUF883 family membrane-anchored ribosome-binding protein